MAGVPVAPEPEITIIDRTIIEIEHVHSQNSLASNTTMLVLYLCPFKDCERCHAALTPVIPLPMMQMSPSSVRDPLLPSSARGLSSGLSQNDLVALRTGSAIGEEHD